MFACDVFDVFKVNEHNAFRGTRRPSSASITRNGAEAGMPESLTFLARIWHAKKSSVQVPSNEGDKVVDGMGFEPTTPALRTPCSPS